MFSQQMEAPMPITLECGQTVKLIAENIEGKSSVPFGKPGAPAPALAQAAAETKAATDAETDAKKNAEADITRQQNEITCGGGDDCEKKTPPPKAAVTKNGKATSRLNADRSGTANGVAKATGKGTVECKKV
jgi:hypothetical protein